jgi:hypothetical protein
MTEQPPKQPRCWHCGQFKSHYGTRRAHECSSYIMGSGFSAANTAAAAQRHGLLKSELIDHSKVHVPSPA